MDRLGDCLRCRSGEEASGRVVPAQRLSERRASGKVGAASNRRRSSMANLRRRVSSIFAPGEVLQWDRTYEVDESVRQRGVSLEFLAGFNKYCSRELGLNVKKTAALGVIKSVSYSFPVDKNEIGKRRRTMRLSQRLSVKMTEVTQTRADAKAAKDKLPKMCLVQWVNSAPTDVRFELLNKTTSDAFGTATHYCRCDLATVSFPMILEAFKAAPPDSFLLCDAFALEVKPEDGVCKPADLDFSDLEQIPVGKQATVQQQPPPQPPRPAPTPEDDSLSVTVTDMTTADSVSAAAAAAAAAAPAGNSSAAVDPVARSERKSITLPTGLPSPIREVEDGVPSPIHEQDAPTDVDVDNVEGTRVFSARDI